MSHYSYEACLERSYKINWRIGDVLDGRTFDPDREWLPRALSGAGQLEFLDAREKRIHRFHAENEGSRCPSTRAENLR